VARRFSPTVRRSYFRGGQHAVLVPTAEIKPHDALRMSQGRKSLPFMLDWSTEP
jgi:hypothetical protein